jgi:surface antigen
MAGIWKLAAAGLLAIGLCACATTRPDYYRGDLPPEPGRNLAEKKLPQFAQCAPYARDHSAVKIFGDASIWWDKASGHFTRGKLPEQGSVLVLTNYAGPDKAHVAVVRRLVSSREIRVDHANWLNDGSIFVNDPVVDVSTANDWSAVKVWNIKNGSWGVRIYTVRGFIGPGAAPLGRLARADVKSRILQ